MFLGARLQSRHLFRMAVNNPSGGWMAIFVIALIVTRRHLVNVVRTLLGMPGGIDDSQEPIRYRTSLLLIVIASLYIIWFCLKAGMTLPIILPFFAFFFAISLAITLCSRGAWSRPHMRWRGCVMPNSFLINILGTRRIGTEQSNSFSIFLVFQRTRVSRTYYAPPT